MGRCNTAVCGFSSLKKNYIKLSPDNFCEQNILQDCSQGYTGPKNQLSVYSSKHIITNAAWKGATRIGKQEDVFRCY